jgi:hypothetical protein
MSHNHRRAAPAIDPTKKTSLFEVPPTIRRSVDVEEEPQGSEFDQAKTEMSGIPVGLVRLDIADPIIVILELALNEEIGLQWR